MRQIAGFCNYFVTKSGEVRSRRGRWGRGCWLKPRINSAGYPGVTLYNSARKKVDAHIHRLVLETYVGPCPEGMECRHLDGNPANNHLDNLKWGTHQENCMDAVKHGTASGLRKGEDKGGCKLTEQQVETILIAHRDGTHTRKELAAYLDINYWTICDIVSRRRWGHVQVEL